MRHRDSPDLRRSSSVRDPRPRVLRVCEGRVTETRYFSALKVLLRYRPLIIDGSGGVPRTLVERAVFMKKEAERRAKRGDPFDLYDETWCVFDVDEHPQLEDARQQAAAHGIQLAVSNPCFELWALLHFVEHRRHDERDRIKRLLKRHVPGFESEIRLPELCASSGYFESNSTCFEALRRAIHLEEERERDAMPGGNPSTGVYRLVERLRDLSRS